MIKIGRQSGEMVIIEYLKMWRNSSRITDDILMDEYFCGLVSSKVFTLAIETIFRNSLFILALDYEVEKSSTSKIIPYRIHATSSKIP